MAVVTPGGRRGLQSAFCVVSRTEYGVSSVPSCFVEMVGLRSIICVGGTANTTLRFPLVRSEPASCRIYSNFPAVDVVCDRSYCSESGRWAVSVVRDVEGGLRLVGSARAQQIDEMGALHSEVVTSRLEGANGG